VARAEEIKVTIDEMKPVSDGLKACVEALRVAVEHKNAVTVERNRYRGALKAIARYVDQERLPDVVWILDRIQEAFGDAAPTSKEETSP
jgi:hypothetical protein